MTTTLLVMRHGEKSGDPDDPHLTSAGHGRAALLANYIPNTFGAPTYIFATSPSPHSVRPYETVKPLAELLTLPIDQTFADQDYGALALRLRTDTALRDGIVVICWHHGNIPNLMYSLGAFGGSYPDPWGRDVFDLILKASLGLGSVEIQDSQIS